METYDLVVVGGGIGGSALAIVAARAGRSVLLLEKSEIFEDQVRGEWIRHHDGPPPLGASREYYVRLLTRFPGDMLTRAAGSTISTLNLPFSVMYGTAPWGVTSRALMVLGESLLATFRERSAQV